MSKKKLTWIRKGEELKEWEAKWKAYQDRIIKLEQARGKAFAKLKGQCTSWKS